MRIDNAAVTNRSNYPEMKKPEAVTENAPAEQPKKAEQPKEKDSNVTMVQQDSQENGDNTQRRIKNAVDHANQTMKHTKTKCEFCYHEETKRVSIKVIDEETEEVVREIPPEETLDMLAKMWELAGLMVDEKR